MRKSLLSRACYLETQNPSNTQTLRPINVVGGVKLTTRRIFGGVKGATALFNNEVGGGPGGDGVAENFKSILAPHCG